jgi:putative component of membrane protein insertase Oxa1/YidC/SpoIIIJ protein YidD
MSFYMSLYSHLCHYAHTCSGYMSENIEILVYILDPL